MKEILLQYAAYHTWANGLLLFAIASLPEELHRREVPSSFNSLYKTVLHLWDAESIWWQRMQNQENMVRPMHSFTGSLPEAVAGLQLQNRQWQEWVAGCREPELQELLHYRNLRGEPFTQPVYQVLLHLFNHGTYHRGQLVNMLRQLGTERIPQTDFIVWTRENRLQAMDK